MFASPRSWPAGSTSAWGPKLIVTAGAVCMCTGGLLLSRLVSRDLGLVALVPGMLVLGVGTGLFYSSVTTAGVTALDPSRAGLAGGIVYMSQVAGGSIGLGLTTAIFTTVTQGSAAGGRRRCAPRRFTDRSGGRRACGHRVGSARDRGVPKASRGPSCRSWSARPSSTACRWGFRFAAVLALASVVVSALVVGGEAPRPR